jgi:hypothetical protein
MSDKTADVTQPTQDEIVNSVAAITKESATAIAGAIKEVLDVEKTKQELEKEKEEIEKAKQELAEKEAAIKKAEEDRANEIAAAKNLETKGAGATFHQEQVEINPILQAAIEESAKGEKAFLADLDDGTSIFLFKGTAKPKIKSFFANLTADGAIITSENIKDVSQHFIPKNLTDAQGMEAFVSKTINEAGHSGLEYKSADKTQLLQKAKFAKEGACAVSVSVFNSKPENQNTLNNYVLSPKKEVKSDGLVPNTMSSNNSIVSLYRTQTKVVLPTLPVDEYADMSPLWDQIPTVRVNRVAGEIMERNLFIPEAELRRKRAPYNQPSTDKTEFSGLKFQSIDGNYAKMNETFQLVTEYNIVSFTPQMVKMMRSGGTIDPQLKIDLLNNMVTELDYRIKYNILSAGRATPDIENIEWQKLSQAGVQGIFAPVLGETRAFDKSMPTWLKNRYFRFVQGGADFDESGYNVTATGTAGVTVYNTGPTPLTGTLVNNKDIPCMFNNLEGLLKAIKDKVPEISASVLGTGIQTIVIPETIFNSLPLNSKYKLIGNDGQKTVFGDGYGNYMANMITVFMASGLGYRFVAMPDRFFPNCFYTQADADGKDTGNIVAVSGRILRPNAVYAYFGNMSNLGYLVKGTLPDLVNPVLEDLKFIDQNDSSYKEIKFAKASIDYQFVYGARQRIFEIRAPQA